MAHKHRAKTSMTVGFRHGVGTYNGGKCNPMSHGGVLEVSTCSCGAKRYVNSTGHRRNESSGWITGEDA